MPIRLSVPKGTGDCLGNFIRQIGMTYTESFRLIGFTLHNNNSVNLFKVENAFQLASTLHDLDFVFTQEPSEGFVSVNYDFTDTLKVEDLSNGIVRAKFKDTPYLNTRTDKENITILSSPSATDSRLTLYFRKSRGIHNVVENKQFLELMMSDASNTIVGLGSDHSELTACTYSVIEQEGDHDILEVKLDGIGGSESELFKKIVSFGSSLVNSLEIS